MKVAILSNINLNPIIRTLSKEMDVFEVPGYGNEMGILMNPNSSLIAFHPEVVFLIVDLMELVHHETEQKKAYNYIKQWFSAFEISIKNDWTYYISDVYCYSEELKIVHSDWISFHLESIWREHLERCKHMFSNVRIFPYHAVIAGLGEKQAFSLKMWYMGKILHSSEMQKLLCETIKMCIYMETRQPKKLLLLDLDNTLWGGLAGEQETREIVLSDDGLGLAYKNFQRVLLQMKNRGVLLSIISKNNPEDVNGILSNHPHMILRPSDFVSQKVNWIPKHENIMELAKELNLGLDSMVFFDDSAAERQLIREALPQVTVPDFPDSPEHLPETAVRIYKEYFEKPFITEEDRNKTLTYHQNRQRETLRSFAVSFDDYLSDLQIELIRENPSEHEERLEQLMNKTNQFNLTTKRFVRTEMAQILQSTFNEIFLYRVTDRFGDNGIVAAAIVEYGEKAVISEFVMSCRVMGRNIEQAVVEDMEHSARQRGYSSLYGWYVPTMKNRPVSDLYPSLGYQKAETQEDGNVLYVISLSEKNKRSYRLTRRQNYENENFTAD